MNTFNACGCVRYALRIEYAFGLLMGTEVLVQAAAFGLSARFQQVAGKLDTGACRTVLNGQTAELLGVEATEGQDTLRTATGEPLPCRIAPVRFALPSSGLERVEFLIWCRVCSKIRSNLFGVDWLDHWMIAFDSCGVTMMRG